jgi:hypothetical protein
MSRTDYVRKCKLIENFNPERRATYEPVIAIPLMAGGGKLKFFDEPLYKFNIFACELSKRDVYARVKGFHDDYIYLCNWAIGRLDIDETKIKQLLNLADITYHTTILKKLGNTEDGDLYYEHHISGLVSVIDRVFHPALNIPENRITKTNIGTLHYAMYANIFGYDKYITDHLLPNRCIIAYGALGKRAAAFIPKIEAIITKPLTYWDASADGTHFLNRLPVSKPDFSTLNQNDIIIVIPKSPDIYRYVKDNFGGTVIDYNEYNSRYKRLWNAISAFPEFFRTKSKNQSQADNQS